MPKELFVERRFSRKSEKMIEAANAIIQEYRAAGFVLTLRQLYYQFVSRDLLPNRQSEYKRLGSVVNDGRLAGRIDWDAIEDRTRNVRSMPHWSDPASIVDACAQQFRVDLWATQPRRVEVWIEKDALVGVVEGVCNRYDAPFFACRGYTSQSEQWRAGRRFRAWRDAGQEVVVLHLGDHDPSGIDMTRDNKDRLDMFATDDVEVRRLALNMDQVKKYKPPPNPAKMTDSRFGGYADRFGKSSWELDALEPRVIEALIEKNLKELIDAEAWSAAAAEQEKGRALLGGIVSSWDKVVATLEEEE